MQWLPTMTTKAAFLTTFVIILLKIGRVRSIVEEKSCSSEESCSIQTTPSSNSKCGLYLAPSTIPGAGLGLFAGDEKNPGDIVGPGDVAIPIVDIKYHASRRIMANGKKGPRVFNMFADYQWAGKVMGMQQESDDDINGVTAHVPGLDAVINCHLGLLNVGKAVPIFNDGTTSKRGATRYTSPGSGAMTPYYNGTTRVTNYIPAGGELFKFYGDNYFTSRKQMGLIPLREDYNTAEETCNVWMALNVKDTIKDDLWSSLVVAQPWESRATNALPETPALARQVSIEGIRSIHQPHATRSLEELEQIGRCQDNIRHGPSELPHAGRGAFATRPLKSGAIVAGSPVLHIPDRNFTYMYDLKWIDPPGTWRRDLEKRQGSQLLVNYCWGHVHSTLLLCPYGTGINFLNHNRTLANIRLQWPSAPSSVMSHNATWLQLAPSEMFQYKISLAMDYVALRDIEEGEELFIDYGYEWEKAWQEHTRKWKPSKKWEHYAPAQVWNEQMGKIPLRTRKEQRYEPYPKHILVHCHHFLTRDNDWMEYIRERGEALWRLRDKGIKCEIRKRYWNLNELVYQVQFSYNDDTAPTIREDVPRRAFLFVDAPYSTDIHQSTAFRHAAQLPEGMVPTTWRNSMQLRE